MSTPLVERLAAHHAVVAGQVGAIYMNSQKAADYVRDFSQVITAGMQGFVGRTEVLGRLDALRAAHAHGYFRITAKAGLGKTALAAAIATRYGAIPFFANTSRGLVRAEQLLTHLCGELITRFALPYAYLPARAGEDPGFLNDLLGEATRKSAGATILVLVDALDEAEPPARGANPLLLPPWVPPGVLFVVTDRGECRLVTDPGTPVEVYEILRDAPAQMQDVEDYLRGAAARRDIADALARAVPKITVDRFVAQLKAASEGNFMYLGYLLADITARAAAGRAIDLQGLPQGLQGYYASIWDEMQEARDQAGWADWTGLFRPVIESLAAAAEAVPAEWIAKIVGREPAEIRERALLPWVRLLAREQRNGHETWRIVHRTFAEFLAKEVDLKATHRAIAERYLANGGPGAWDDYGLRHVPTHLARAARLAAQPERHTLVVRLVDLVTNAAFQQAQLARFQDPTMPDRDLALAVRTVVEDDDPTSAAHVVRAALPLVSFRRNQRRPEPIFALAERGETEQAERGLALFAHEIEPEWQAALQLSIAWLAAAANPAKAKALRDRVADTMPAGPVLETLIARLDAVLAGTTHPQGDLPPAPPPDLALAMVARLSGSAYNHSLLADVPPELVSAASELFGSQAYLAVHDGPLLVALAVQEPGLGEALLREYVGIHTAYGYRQYRNGSLLALLHAILRHPDARWVRSWLPVLGPAVLAPERGDFQEGVELAVLARQALAGEGNAAVELERRRESTLALAHQLGSAASPEALPAWMYGESAPADLWGKHKRRLGAIAEALARLPGGSAAAEELVRAATLLPYGFAGFQAPACLVLAETAEIVLPHDVALQELALESARSAAHNIQDPVFCARTTARCNALSKLWWTPAPRGAALVEYAQRLGRDPTLPEFAALHTIGESYDRRSHERSIPLPAWQVEAGSLADLSNTYGRPLAGFLELNAEHGWGMHDRLPPGTEVRVPDPGFPPLLAARLAGAALADATLSEAERMSAIRPLVPVAAQNLTALDTVLSRLVLASSLQDAALLAKLQQLAGAVAVESGPEAALTGTLTRVVP